MVSKLVPALQGVTIAAGTSIQRDQTTDSTVVSNRHGIGIHPAGRRISSK
jgi:hypothetical protein